MSPVSLLPFPHPNLPLWQALFFLTLFLSFLLGIVGHNKSPERSVSFLLPPSVISAVLKSFPTLSQWSRLDPNCPPVTCAKLPTMDQSTSPLLLLSLGISLILICGFFYIPQIRAIILCFSLSHQCSYFKLWFNTEFNLSLNKEKSNQTSWYSNYLTKTSGIQKIQLWPRR